jgi:hypothetical protein
LEGNIKMIDRKIESLTFPVLRQMNLINEKELRDLFIVNDFKEMRAEGLTVEAIIEICSQKKYNNQYLSKYMIRYIIYKKGLS